jgi:hypothetical protein
MTFQEEHDISMFMYKYHNVPAWDDLPGEESVAKYLDLFYKMRKSYSRTWYIGGIQVKERIHE